MSIAIADERPSRRSVARAGRRLARQSKPPKRCRCATNSEAACLRSRKPPVMMRLPRHQTSHPDRRALLIQIVAVHFFVPQQPTTAELARFGFRPLGCWEMLRNKIKARLSDRAEGAGWIYAFATGERVRYFGISDRVIRCRSQYLI